ncbi:MAG: hypothetical protein JXA30_10070 [Deltaproteobacteria bacterium]|nr:hypothetical protein [Deltaproteobacteria bacterium]
MSTVTEIAGLLQGYNRMRIEEPVRELVLDLDDIILRRETTLDARRNGVDLDRGEILPSHTMWDLKRTAFLTGVDINNLSRYIDLPDDYSKPIDTAAVVLVGRAFSNMYWSRSQRLRLRIVKEKSSSPLMRHEQYILDRADYDSDLARRWAALSKHMVQGSI